MRRRAAPRRSRSPGPAWSSLVTSCTPDRPRAARPRRNASQPAPSSELVTSMPRISRYPSALTPVAIRQCTFTVRPPSRTFWVSASIQHERVRAGVQRPVPEPLHQLVQLRRHRADLRLGQAHHAQGGGELLHPPGRDTQQVTDVATTEASARSARRRCSRNDGKYDPCRSFGIASSTVPARVSHSRRRYPFREFTRSGVTSPYPALHRTSTSASIIRWANSRIISRSTSGPADARVSSNCAPATGTMSPTATSLSFVAMNTTSKDREVAASHHGDTPD